MMGNNRKERRKERVYSFSNAGLISSLINSFFVRKPSIKRMNVDALTPFFLSCPDPAFCCHVVVHP
jgi:hypothetical protein